MFRFNRGRLNQQELVAADFSLRLGSVYDAHPINGSTQAKSLRLPQCCCRRQPPAIQLLERRYKMEEKKLPVYESPKVVTYTDEELLEELGPAQTGYVKGDSAF